MSRLPIKGEPATILIFHSPKSEEQKPTSSDSVPPSATPADPAPELDPSPTAPEPVAGTESEPTEEPTPAPDLTPSDPPPPPREPVREIPTWPSYAVRARLRLVDAQNPGRTMYLSKRIDEDGYVVYTEDIDEALIAGCVSGIHQRLLVQVRTRSVS